MSHIYTVLFICATSRHLMPNLLVDFRPAHVHALPMLRDASHGWLEPAL